MLPVLTNALLIADKTDEIDAGGESGSATVTVKAEDLPEIKVPVEIAAPTPGRLKK